MGQEAALEKGLELVFDELGRACSCLELPWAKKLSRGSWTTWYRVVFSGRRRW